VTELAGAAFAVFPLMRAILLAVIVSGCTSSSLDNTAYRRLVDAYDTNDQCLAEGNFAQCYQTLTFCANGRASAMLDTRQEGKYEVDGDAAIANLPTITVVFDLDKQQSSQLPGRHPWELVTPLYYDCE
jgi:hypothetical protein